MQLLCLKPFPNLSLAPRGALVLLDSEESGSLSERGSISGLGVQQNTWVAVSPGFVWCVAWPTGSVVSVGAAQSGQRDR